MHASAHLEAMVEARVPAHAARLCSPRAYIAACGKHAHGPEEGCSLCSRSSPCSARLLALLKARGHLDGCRRHACLSQRRPGIGLIFYKLLRSRGVDLDEKSALDLLAALEALGTRKEPLN